MSCQCSTSIRISRVHKSSDTSSEKLERSFLFTSGDSAVGKWFPNLERDPAGPLVNVKLAHFIFSHLPFSVHTLAISARSLPTVCMCVCVLCVWRVTEFTWAESSGVVELVRPWWSDVRWAVPPKNTRALHVYMRWCVCVSYRPCIRNMTSIHTLAVC